MVSDSDPKQNGGVGFRIISGQKLFYHAYIHTDTYHILSRVHTGTCVYAFCHALNFKSYLRRPRHNTCQKFALWSALHANLL